MATNPEELEGAEAPQPPEAEAPPEGAPPEEGQGNEQPADPLAPIAERMGWVPKDRFNGPADAWKPAEQFILDGKDIQRSLSQELKALRQQQEVIARTSASIVEQQVQERVAKLAEAHSQAVEDGDAAQAYRISEQIRQAQAPLQQQRNAQPVEAQSFVERNNWFAPPNSGRQGDPLATARAIRICDELASQGYDHATQLQYAEQAVRREFPHLFQNGQAQQQQGKPPASVSQPGSRVAAPANRQRTFADMPPAAQKIARDMVERGVIPNVDAYVKNWIAQEKGRG